MELTKNDPAVCPDSIDAPDSSTGAVEIDLYDELITFAELSPEEQSRLAYLSDKERAQPDEEPSAPFEGPAHSEPDLAPGPVELDFAVQHAEAAADPVTNEFVAEPENRSNVLIEPTESPSVTLKSSVQSHETAAVQLEPVLNDAQSETVASEPAQETWTALAGEDEQSTQPDIEAAVEAVKVAPASEAGESETSKPSGATNGIRTSGMLGPRPSGPLSGFNLPPEIVYTGAMSRGVCLACGAESGADDLFCLTCGVFIDEVASSLPSNPTCADCHERIDADEIFCPWCGSSVV